MLSLKDIKVGSKFTLRCEEVPNLYQIASDPFPTSPTYVVVGAELIDKINHVTKYLREKKLRLIVAESGVLKIAFLDEGVELFEE